MPILVPILVEYRRLPGAPDEPAQDIDWSAGAATPQSAVKVRTLAVEGDNSDWTSTGIVLSPDELVFGRARGKVTFGGWGTAAEPDASGSGGLEMRVGTMVVPAGKAWVTDIGLSGEVKLRVRDNKHSDNKGRYEVALVVMSRDALLADCQVLDAQGAVTSCP